MIKQRRAQADGQTIGPFLRPSGIVNIGKDEASGLRYDEDGRQTGHLLGTLTVWFHARRISLVLVEPKSPARPNARRGHGATEAGRQKREAAGPCWVDWDGLGWAGDLVGMRAVVQQRPSHRETEHAARRLLIHGLRARPCCPGPFKDLDPNPLLVALLHRASAQAVVGGSTD